MNLPVNPHCAKPDSHQHPIFLLSVGASSTSRVRHTRAIITRVSGVMGPKRKDPPAKADGDDSKKGKKSKAADTVVKGEGTRKSGREKKAVNYNEDAIIKETETKPRAGGYSHPNDPPGMKSTAYMCKTPMGWLSPRISGFCKVVHESRLLHLESLTGIPLALPSQLTRLMPRCSLARPSHPRGTQRANGRLAAPRFSWPFFPSLARSRCVVL